MRLKKLKNTSEKKIQNCSEEEILILSKLTEPKTREELLTTTGLELTKLQISISMLEIRGLVSEEYGCIRKIKSIHV